MPQLVIDGLTEALGGLYDDVAGEAVAHHHLGQPPQQVLPLKVPCKVQPALLEQVMALPHQAVPLLLLLPTGEEGNAGGSYPPNPLHIAGPQVSELEEELGTAVRSGPHIQDDGGAGGGGIGQAEGGAFPPTERAPDQEG